MDLAILVFVFMIWMGMYSLERRVKDIQKTIEILEDKVDDINFATTARRHDDNYGR